MKLTDVKDKIDLFFEKIDSQKVIEFLESLGYEFEEVNDIETNLKTK
jgi:hypothetical protein